MTLRVESVVFLRVAFAIAIALDVLLLGTYAGERLEPFRTLSVFGGGAVVLLALRCAKSFRDEVDIAVVATLLCFLVACMTSVYPRQSFDAALSALFYVAAFLLARRLLANQGTRGLFIATMAIVGAGIAIFVGLLWAANWLIWLAASHYAILPPLDLYLPSGIYGYRHYLAILLVLLSPAVVSLMRGTQLRVLRYTLALALVLGVFVITAAGSRNIWLSALAAASVTALPYVRRRPLDLLRQLRGASAVFAAAGAVFILALIANQLVPRVLNLQTLTARGELWTSSFQLFLQKPLTGYGPGSFPFLLSWTDYFQQNTYAPPNPDSALLQLMAEVGVAGIVGVVILTVGLARAWVHGPFDARPLFALVFFMLTSLATGPTDYGYLILPLLLWVAFAVPSDSVPPRSFQKQRTRSPIRWATLLFAAILAVAVGSTVVGSLSFATARERWTKGQPTAAIALIDTAIATDPGMAIYWRSRGEIQLALNAAPAATASLESAERINPADPLTLRALALAYAKQGRLLEAQTIADRAVELQRSDTDTVVLDAYIHSLQGDVAGAEALAAEALQQDPLLIADDNWERIVDPRRLQHVIRTTSDIYSTELGTTVGIGLDSIRAAWLAALTHSPRLDSVVEQETPRPLLSIARAMSDYGFCHPTQVLDSIQDAPISAVSGPYWNIRLIFEGLAGVDRSDSARMGSLQQPGLGELSQGELSRSALVQNAPATDIGGYGRLRFPIAVTPPLPSSAHSSNLWLADGPSVVRRLASLGIARCIP